MSIKETFCCDANKALCHKWTSVFKLRQDALCVFAPRVIQLRVSLKEQLLLRRRRCAKSCKSRQPTSAVLCLKGEVNHPADAARWLFHTRSQQARLPIKAEATFQIYRDNVLSPLMGNMEKFLRHKYTHAFLSPRAHVCVSETKQNKKLMRIFE